MELFADGRCRLNQKLPRHVAIVMDGNGRWAENRGLQRMEGHKAGVDTVKTIVRSCLDHKIEVLSLFAFSSENWARPIMEVEFLMQLFIQAIKRELPELHELGVALRFIGDRAQLSSSLCEEIKASEQVTNHNGDLILNVALNYGGKWDIIQAAKALAGQVMQHDLGLDDINEDAFTKLLSTNALPEPDLFIRTSGEQRISNFFLWQLAYTELYFSDLLWPDFSVSEFEKALRCFGRRKRRYGLTEEKNNV